MSDGMVAPSTEYRSMLRRYSSVVYSLMRAVLGFLFACHGAQKLFGVLGRPAEVGDPMGLAAGLIEFFGGGAILLGIGTSIASFIASGEMAVAFVLVSRAHTTPWYWPIMNHAEGAAFYSWVFLFMACEGDGRWSVGELWRRWRRTRMSPS
jgi:putative oxidoreductase